MRRKAALFISHSRVGHVLLNVVNGRWQGLRMKLSIAALGLTVLAALSSAGALQAAERRCAKAQHLAGVEKPLPNLFDRIRSGEPIRIVAFGSSSTEGVPSDDKREIYPAVLARMLSREVLTPVDVINKGRGGETIPMMVARIDRDVIAQQPDLVVWQLGVNDVLQMDGVEGAVAEMRGALQRLREMRVPIVLIDLQVGPATDGDRDTPRMQAAIAEAARAEGVLHFNRYEVMRALVSTREAELGELLLADGLHMTPLGHFCTGALLAKQIAKGSMLPVSQGPGAQFRLQAEQRAQR